MAKSSIKLSKKEIKQFLDEKALLYENPKFIGTDPIQIPHQFSKKEDIEIAGFMAATIAWGNRKSIITNANRMMDLMERAPHDFILNHQQDDLKAFDGFVHRTFNAEDLKTFINGLQHLYRNHGGLEEALSPKGNQPLFESISSFKKKFFEIDHRPRTQKHISDPVRKSAAKRLFMYLRWMVRPADRGVDFGIWDSIKPHQLSCPLDVHSGKVARALGLLKRKQNDLAAVMELDNSLRKLDAKDPVKYDYALFGLSAFENSLIF
ncbi:MAG: TIGR02757 family protein [Leeuwenhoekiella sp.]